MKAISTWHSLHKACALNCAKFIIIFLLCPVFIYAQAGSLKTSRVRVFVAKEDIRTLQSYGMEFDHLYYDKETGSMVTSLNQREIALLNKYSFKYIIEVDDELQDFLQRNAQDNFYRNEPGNSGTPNAGLLFDSPDQPNANRINTPAAFTSGSMGGYYTLAEMNTKLDNMKASYPSLVRIDTLPGTTVEGRYLRVLKISDNVNTDESEPEMLYTGMHHAREPMGMMNLIFFMQYLLENYSLNPRIKELVDSRELFFIPCMNPDGFQHNVNTNPGGGGMHRKNKRVNGDGTFGVDLNRNYAYDWGYNNVGSSATTSADNYRGPSAHSEYESQALRNYARTRSFKLMINYHAYGGYWINSFSVPARTLSAADALFAATAGQMMTKYSIYEVGTPTQTVGYEANGSSDDWFLAGDVANIGSLPCFSPEVGLGVTTFYPTSGNIIPQCKEVFYANIQAAMIAGSYVKIENRTPVSLPASLTGNFDFTIRRTGRIDSSITVSIIPIQNVVANGGPVVISGIANYGDTVNRSISYTLNPAVGIGHRIKFAYKIETGGVTMYDTVLAYYNPTVVFSDDMETGAATAKWTISAGWAYTTNSKYGGTRSLAESPAGNYAINQTLNATTLNNLDLTGASTAILSFWVRYKTERGFDKLRIQAASTATGGVYTSLPGLNTITESKGTMGNVPGLTGFQDTWVREFVTLRPHLGQTDVKVRFAFTSNASTGDDGFFIDDVMIIKSNTASLPAEFLSFRGVVKNQTVSLNWEATMSDIHERFEVERSFDGVHFSTIAKINTISHNQYTDYAPALGINYYRIKQLDKDGGFKYSRVLNYTIMENRTVHVFPNPVKQFANIEINGLNEEIVRFDFVDQFGRMIKQEERKISTGMNRLQFDVRALSNQIYYIKIVNDKNEIISVSSFVKS